jgi:hypothetical protein
MITEFKGKLAQNEQKLKDNTTQLVKPEGEHETAPRVYTRSPNWSSYLEGERDRLNYIWIVMMMMMMMMMVNRDHLYIIYSNGWNEVYAFLCVQDEGTFNQHFVEPSGMKMKQKRTRC